MCAATEHIIQTKLATDAKASDSRARRTMGRNPSVGAPVDKRCRSTFVLILLLFSSSSLSHDKPAPTRFQARAPMP
jgi:hypothetical protein